MKKNWRQMVTVAEVTAALQEVTLALPAWKRQTVVDCHTSSRRMNDSVCYLMQAGLPLEEAQEAVDARLKAWANETLAFNEEADRWGRAAQSLRDQQNEEG